MAGSMGAAAKAVVVVLEAVAMVAAAGKAMAVVDMGVVETLVRVVGAEAVASTEALAAADSEAEEVPVMEAEGRVVVEAVVVAMGAWVRVAGKDREAEATVEMEMVAVMEALRGLATKAAEAMAAAVVAVKVAVAMAEAAVAMWEACTVKEMGQTV